MANRTYIAENSLAPGIKTLPGYVNRVVTVTTRAYAPKTEAFAKEHAPWTDRTSNARNGLSAKAGKNNAALGGPWWIVLFHQVEYGIWLEVANGRKFEVILPTISEMGPRVMRALQGILSHQIGKL